MHSLTHLVESICRRGVISASSTDCGEALHPQGQKDWSRTNHRGSALKQVSISSVFYFYHSKLFNRCCKCHMSRRQSSRSGQRWIGMTGTSSSMEVGRKPFMCHLVLWSQGWCYALRWDHVLQPVHMVSFYLKILASRTLALISTTSFKVE